jgi:hypothetical protein
MIDRRAFLGIFGALAAAPAVAMLRPRAEFAGLRFVESPLSGWVDPPDGWEEVYGFAPADALTVEKLIAARDALLRAAEEPVDPRFAVTPTLGDELVRRFGFLPASVRVLPR